MKGISAVIGALIVLIITIVLGGLAYTYITSVATSKIAVVLEVDPTSTTCAINGSAYSITTGILNSGTTTLPLSSITLKVVASNGTSATSRVCGPSNLNVNAGQRASCTNEIGAWAGNNALTVTGGGSSAQGVISC